MHYKIFYSTVLKKIIKLIFFRLAALVGSQDTDTIYPLHAAWGSSATPVKQENKPDVSGLQQTIQSYVREGLSQRM